MTCKSELEITTSFIWIIMVFVPEGILYFQTTIVYKSLRLYRKYCWIWSKLKITLGLCKIDSWIWTIFSFFLHMMTWWLVLVMVPTVFDKTQARARKSIFCLKSYKNVAVNILELIRDKLKKILEMKIQVLNGITFKNGIDSTCRLETTAFAKLVVKMCLVVP